jgi:hypothetical protein
MPTLTPPHREDQTATPAAGTITDATRREPLAIRAQKRKAELEKALLRLPREDLRARAEIAQALTSVGDSLTGSHDHRSYMTAAELNRWLETTKHLAETATPADTQPDIGEPGSG